MRLPILLLISTSFAFAAPTSSPIDHELAAKQFFGSAVEKFQTGKHAELFDQLFAKWEHLYPDMVPADQAAEIRAAFIKLRENKGEGEEKSLPLSIFLSIAPTLGKIQMEVQRRIGELNDEGAEFMKKTFASIPADAKQLRLLTTKFDAFRAEFEALDNSTKKKLAKQFVIFDHLDEVKGLVTVFARLFGALDSACQNLHGFSECDQHFRKQ